MTAEAYPLQWPGKLPLSERLLALQEFLPRIFTGRLDVATDAAALLDECATALARGEADSRRLDKLTLDPTCMRSIGVAVYPDGPKGYRRMASLRHVLDAAISWDDEMSRALTSEF